MHLTKSIPVMLMIMALFIPGMKLDGQEGDVPEAIVSQGTIERVAVVRIKKDGDLLRGLQAAIREEGIKNAVILSGIGSLTEYHLHVVDNRIFPTKNVFFRDTIPVDLTSVNGYVFDGRIHAHIGISDENLALGGHLEPGCTVFTFAIITIGVFSDAMNLDRFDDKYWH